MIRGLLARVILQLDDRSRVDTETAIKRSLNEATNPDKAKGNVDEVGGAFERLSKKVKIFGELIGAAFAVRAVKQFVDESVAKFTEFDAKLQQSVAIMGDVSDEMRTKMGAAAMKMAEDLNIPAAKIAEGFFFLASSGMDAAQSLASLPVVANFAKAGMFDLAKASEMLMDAQNALGLASNDATENMRNMNRVSDVLVKGNIVANASVEQLATSLSRKSAAAMRLNNIQVEEGVAVLAAYAAQGMKGEIAGEAFSRFLLRLTAAYRENTSAFKKMGIELFDKAGNWLPLATVVDNLSRALNGLTPAAQSAAFAQLGFTTEASDAIRPLIGLGDKIREYQSALQSAGGASVEIANKQLRGVGETLGQLQEKFNNLKIEIGQDFTEGVMKAAIAVDGEGGLTETLDHAKMVMDVNSEATRNLGQSWMTVKKFGLDVAIGAFNLLYTGLHTIADFLVGTLASAFGIAMIPLTMFSGLISMFMRAIEKLASFAGHDNPIARFFRSIADATDPNKGARGLIEGANAAFKLAGENFTLSDMVQGYERGGTPMTDKEKREALRAQLAIAKGNAARAKGKNGAPPPPPPPGTNVDPEKAADFMRDLTERVASETGTAMDTAMAKIDALQAKAVEVFGKTLPANVQRGLDALRAAARQQDAISEKKKEFGILSELGGDSDYQIDRMKAFIKTLEEEGVQLDKTGKAREAFNALMADANKQLLGMQASASKRRAQELRDQQESWQRIVENARAQFKLIEDAAGGVAYGIAGAFQDAFGLIYAHAFTLRNFMVVIGRQIGAALLGGLAQYASGKVAENIASAFEEHAKATASFASFGLGNPLGLAMGALHEKAAKDHLVAAGAWAVLAGAAGASQSALSGGGAGGRSGGVPSGATDIGAREVEAAKKQGPNIIVQVKEFDPMNPRAQEALAETNRYYEERYGGTVTVQRTKR